MRPWTSGPRKLCGEFRCRQHVAERHSDLHCQDYWSKTQQSKGAVVLRDLQTDRGGLPGRVGNTWPLLGSGFRNETVWKRTRWVWSCRDQIVLDLCSCRQSSVSAPSLFSLHFPLLIGNMRRNYLWSHSRTVKSRFQTILFSSGLRRSCRSRFKCFKEEQQVWGLQAGPGSTGAGTGLNTAACSRPRWQRVRTPLMFHSWTSGTWTCSPPAHHKAPPTSRRTNQQPDDTYLVILS